MFVLVVTVHHQGKPRQESEGRNGSKDHEGTTHIGLFPGSYSDSFLIQLGTTYLERVPYTVVWVLLHNLAQDNAPQTCLQANPMKPILPLERSMQLSLLFLLDLQLCAGWQSDTALRRFAVKIQSLLPSSQSVEQ